MDNEFAAAVRAIVHHIGDTLADMHAHMSLHDFRITGLNEAVAKLRAMADALERPTAQGDMPIAHEPAPDA